MLRTAYLTSGSNLGAHISLIEMERISDMPLNDLSTGLSLKVRMAQHKPTREKSTTSILKQGQQFPLN